MADAINDIDQTEGSGLGIITVLIMLKKLGLAADHLKFKTTDSETVATIEIPKGYAGLIFPRSSVFKTNLGLRNCVGVIDSDYRGEITFKFRPDAKYPIVYNIGDAVGQMIILKIPAIEFVETELLSDTKRGSGGYGSTGK